MCIFAKLNIQMPSNNNSLNQFITTMDNNETSIKQFVLLGEDNSQYRDYAGSYFTKANLNFYRTMKTVFRRSGIMKDNRLGNVEWRDDNMETALSSFDITTISATQMSSLSDHLFRNLPMFGPIMSHDKNAFLSPLKRAKKALDKAKKDLKNAKKAHQDEDKYEKLKNVAEIEYNQQKENFKNEMYGTEAKDMWDKLINIAGALLYYRNLYTHKNPYSTEDDENKQKEREIKIAKWMNSVFEGEKGILIERKKYKYEDTLFLIDHQKETDRMEKRGNKYVERDNFYFKIKILDENNKCIGLTDFGRFFFCSLFLRRSDSELYAKSVKLFENSPYCLTEQELKIKQAEENKRAATESQKSDHQVNPKTIDITESAQINIIREMMQMHRIRIPREKKIDFTPSESMLLMDILNELRRCPQELYDTFNQTDKLKFVVDNPNEDPESDSKITLTRSKDRFAHLALRLIDHTDALGSIRFHLRLGLFRFRFYDKKLIDNSETLRRVHKEINGFGKWHVVESLRREKWGKYNQKFELNDDGLLQFVPDSAESDPYITDWQTTYNIHANRIGLFWNGNSQSEDYYIPELKTMVDENSKVIAPVEMKIPLCSLSIYDLPAILFYTYIFNLYNGNRLGLPNAEKIIKNKYTALNEFFGFAKKSESTPEELIKKQEELNLHDSEIPERLLYLMGKIKTPKGKIAEWKPNSKRNNHAKELLKKIIEEDEWRIKSFKDKKNKIEDKNRYGRKDYSDIRHGVLAKYLVESMMMWQPGKQKAETKISSANYRALRDYLSNYNNNSNNLQFVLKAAHLIDSENPHPFINKVKGSNIELYYTNYLHEELKHARGILSELEDNNYTGDKKEIIPPFAKPESDKWNKKSNTIQSCAAKYLEHPIQLPDGLFTQAIIDLLKAADIDETIKNDATKDSNATYIIRYWFDKVGQDSPQLFYDSTLFKRSYKFIDKCFLQKDEGNQTIKHFLTEKEILDNIKNFRGETGSLAGKLYPKDKLEESKKSIINQLNEVKDKEKAIRRYRVQDIALFLLARKRLVELLSKSENSNRNEARVETTHSQNNISKKANNLKLKDFGFDEDFHFLSGSEDNGDGLLFEYEYIVDNDANKKIMIVQEGLSLKNYGNIYRVLGDNRIKTLMQLLYEIKKDKVEDGTITFTFAELVKELTNNDKLHHEFYRLFQNIEQEAYDGTGGFDANKKNKEVLDNPDDEQFFFVRQRKNGEVTTKEAVRNSFKKLIELLKQYSTDEGIIVQLRNDAIHDRYPEPIAEMELKETGITESLIEYLNNLIKKNQEQL